MADNLVIVESPSKAKTIKKYLGKNYDVIASDGHIIDIPASRFGIDVDNDFELEYIKMRGKAKKINEIKKVAKDFKKVLLAPDPDREGEAIAFHLKNILDIKDNDKCRISFNEITKEAVKKAVKEPRMVDMSLVAAQQTRRALDRVVGYKISPLLWKKVKRGLSAGRVQSSVMKIIIDREREIRNFKPEEYWNLEAILDKDKKDVLAKFYGDKKGKIELTNEKDTMKVVNSVEKKDFKVIDVKKSEKKKNPSPPFTTSSLGQDASRKLGFSIKKTMMVAQKLYEAGHITYMRTDSIRISDDAKVMAKDYIVSNFGSKYYLNRNFKTKNNAQDAHEAIRPTKLTEINKLTNDESKLYNLILNRFLASQMSSAIYDTTKITYDVNNYIFNSTGSIIKFDGFMKLYKPAGKEEKDNILPNIEKDDILKQKK